jgi:hypothetical protein
MIDIYGDSFADPAVTIAGKPIGYGGFRPWHERLGKVRNFAKSSTGPHYSLRELYKCYKKYTKDDHIIFIISGHNRIHFHVPEEFKQKDSICPEDAMWDPVIQRITLYKEHRKKPQEKQKWYDKHNQHMDYACRTFQEEIDTLTEKCESFLYMISRLQQCKVTVFLLSTARSYMKDRLNDDLFYLHNYGLMTASNEEFINFKQNRYPKWELRANHLSKENHDIMTDIIQTRTFKPFKKNFVDSTPFEQVEERFIYD